jgi:hypothetical protein
MAYPIKQRSTITKLVKTIQHRQLDFAVRDITDIIDHLNSLDTTVSNLSFLDLIDTPVAYGSVGQTLVVNAAGDGLEFATTTDTNTWDMANVGFVDPSVPFGSGTLGDGNDPFRRVLDAVNAGASYIWLKPATYTETITLQSNKTYYCPAGVKFTSGGLRAPSGTLSFRNIV